MTTDIKFAKLVIVNPGMPNQGILVGPANFEYEKVDLTHRPGIERWEALKQIMHQFCEPGKSVPEPISFNPNHPHNPETPPPPASKWPRIILVGHILETIPDQVRPRMPSENLNQKLMDERVARLESRLDKLIDVIAGSKRTEVVAAPDTPTEDKDEGSEPAKKRGRPRKEA